jgi:LuxR family maltose regulon positive regulatory protein
LAEIEAANLFLSRVDEDGAAFHYHQLFVDLLREQLRSRDPARYREQHRLAADACMRRSNITAAIDHYWAAGERRVAARLINENLLSVIYSTTGTFPPIDAHVDISSNDPRTAFGEVAGYATALLMRGRHAEARHLLEQVDLSAPAVTMSERMHLQCLWLPARFMLGDSTRAAQAADRIIDLIVCQGVPADGWLTMAIPLAIKAYAWEGNFARVDQLLGLRRPSVNPDLEHADVVSSVAFAHYEEGLLADAVAATESVRNHATAAGIDIVARAVLGNALVEMGDFEAANEHLGAVLNAHNSARIPMFVLASLGRARMMRATGQFDAAMRTLATARGRLLSPVPTTISNRIDEMEISIRLDLGDIARATDVANRLIPGWRADAMSTWIAIAGGRFDDATALVDKVACDASTPRRRLNVVMMRAQIAARCKQPELESLANDALQLAEATGAVLRIAEAGPEVLHEVCEIARQGPRTDFVDRLMAAQPLLRPTSQVVPPYRVDELSAREVIVLQYLATSMSYQEIAAALYLSINTVKTHVKNVLRKLSASSRSEAVRRATELHYF